MASSNRSKLSFMFTGRVNWKRPGAFTLLEVTLAVLILGLMSLAVYRFVQSNLIAMRASSEVNTADARYDGLRDLLLSQWQSLPPGKGAMIGEPAKLNDRPRDEIRWISGAGAGLLTRYAPGDFDVWLRIQPEAKDKDQFDLGLLRRPRNEPGNWARTRYLGTLN